MTGRRGLRTPLCQFVGGVGSNPRTPWPIWLRTVTSLASSGTPSRSRTSSAGLEGPCGGSAPRGPGTGSTSRTRLAGFGGPPAPGAPGTNEKGRRICSCGPCPSSTFGWRLSRCHLLRQRQQPDTCAGGQGYMYPSTARRTRTAGDYSPTLLSPARLVWLMTVSTRPRLPCTTTASAASSSIGSSARQDYRNRHSRAVFRDRAATYQTKRPQDLLLRPLSFHLLVAVTSCHSPGQGPQADPCAGGRGYMYPWTARRTRTAGDYSPTLLSPALLVWLSSALPRPRLL
jgi:hypothetical protein